MERNKILLLAGVMIAIGIVGLIISSSTTTSLSGFWMMGDYRGMMGGMMGAGMMGNMMQMMGGNMLLSGGVAYNSDGTPVTFEQAKGIANRYLNAQNNPDLELSELEEWEFNFYAEYKEKSTGIKALQIVIDKYSGTVSPEMGPNMMWNTKYGMLGIKAGATTITQDQAQELTRKFLDARLPDTSAEYEGMFYGYYHFDVKKDNKTYGMLDVNGYSGQVWYHTWHGNFVGEEKEEKT